MNTRRVAQVLGLLAGAAFAANPPSAEACAACFGRSDSPMAQGMNMGILSLLAVIMSVLFAIAIFFAYILRRAARLAREERLRTGQTSTPGSLASAISQSTS